MCVLCDLSGTRYGDVELNDGVHVYTRLIKALDDNI